MSVVVDKPHKNYAYSVALLCTPLTRIPPLVGISAAGEQFAISALWRVRVDRSDMNLALEIAHQERYS